MIVNVRNQASHLMIRRTRKLPIPGQVLVNQGEKVSPEVVIAQAELPGGIVFLDLAKGLSLPVEDVRACLTRKIGEHVQVDDVVASCEGAFPRVVRSPVQGQLVECQNGKVVMTTVEIQRKIKAGMSGVVEKIIPELGAVILTWGCLIQGIWGNSRMGTGVLKIFESSPDRPLQLSDLEQMKRGQVIMTNLCPPGDVLEEMISKGISGVIVNFSPPAMIPSLVKAPVPTIVLQGFAVESQDGLTDEMLKANEGKIVTVDAHESDAFDGMCPEVIIPSEKGNFIEDAPLKGRLSVGQEVRIFSGSATGQTGIVSEISEGPLSFASGLSEFAGKVFLETDEEVLVPCKNLMILNRSIH